MQAGQERQAQPALRRGRKDGRGRRQAAAGRRV